MSHSDMCQPEINDHSPMWDPSFSELWPQVIFSKLVSFLDSRPFYEIGHKCLSVNDVHIQLLHFMINFDSEEIQYQLL